MAVCHDGQTAGTEFVAERVTPDDFTSPDLAFFQLKGHVHFLYAYPSVYEFDREGRLLKVDGEDPYDEVRREFDDETDYFNEVTKLTSENGIIVEERAMEWYNDVKWKDGLVVEKSGQGEGMIFRHIFVYNDQGELTWSKEKMWNDGDDEDSEDTTIEEYTYRILKRDNRGNWTLRMCNEMEQKRLLVYYGEEATKPLGPAAYNPQHQSLSFTGTIGGDNNATLSLREGEGEYTVGVGTRKVMFCRYNPCNGNLVLKAYKKSSVEYLGYFDGEIECMENENCYRGTFTNTERKKVSFELKMK